MINKPSPKITAKARPLRVAYAIEDGLDVHKWLDAVFSECFGRHGGRQSLVVPLSDGETSELYIKWLDIFDPDILYLITYDNVKATEFFNELLSPLSILGQERKREAPAEQPRIHLESRGLTSLSWLPFLKVNSNIILARPERILDSYPQWHDDGLITDNFGTLERSFDQFPLLREPNEFVRPFMLTPKDAPDNRWLFRLLGEEVTDGYEALASFSRGGQVTTLAYLSNFHCKHLSIHSHPWLHSFNLVIGDTFIDRLSAWNSGLLYADSRAQPYKSLRVPAESIQHAERIGYISKFIQANNWLGQNNGPAHITIRSSAIDEETLKPFLNQLRKITGSYVIFQNIKSIDDCCPATKNISYVQNTEWPETEVPIRDNVEFVPVPQPIQLQHTSNANPLYSIGEWMVDYRIDRINDNSPYANVRDTWLLPRRAQQVTPQFLNNKQARITTSGYISTSVNREIDQIEIKQPSDSDFFWMLIHEFPHFPYPDLRSKRSFPIVYKDSRPSDKGRYLQGVLGLFQSLYSAHRVLSSHFWRTQFARLAMPSEDQYPSLIVKLKKRLAPDGKYQVENEEQWERLARTVTSQVGDLRLPKYKVTLKNLLHDWRKELSAAIDADKNLVKQKEQQMADSDSKLKSSLLDLCSLGIFHQGYEWTCRHCSYTNWNSIDNLKSVISCQVCKNKHNVPVDMTLDFRLNKFMATCLREHGTLPVILALGALQDEARSSFVFSPQLELFLKRPQSRSTPSDRELDILCVVDGKIVLGEVKTSVTQIDRAEIDALVAVATDLKPDIIILAALEGDELKLTKKQEEVQSRIPKNIEVKKMLILTQHDELSFYLP
jgi:hypothetical protein